jgi:phosphoribulokinase
LTDREQNWFKEKYKHLDEKHKHDKGCDPNTLLSLNIMKENYDMDTIGKSVAKFVGDPLLRELRDLLKYLAYLNHYDINFQPVPVNSFDPIMATLSNSLSEYMVYFHLLHVYLLCLLIY